MNFAKENQILKDGWRLINELRGVIAEEYYFANKLTADEALTKLLMRSEEIEYNTFKKLSLELKGVGRRRRNEDKN